MGDVKKALKVDSDSPWMDNLLNRSGLDGVSDRHPFLLFRRVEAPDTKLCFQVRPSIKGA
jgi:hypothetical protein